MDYREYVCLFYVVNRVRYLFIYLLILFCGVLLHYISLIGGRPALQWALPKRETY